ncbi:hypothetical protein CQ018_10710 [Arthrobacter sp. MYb227]|uniref:DUF1684 domain-containing protein n=1 Tax=Arthrobacter sp. MYb227 TaxID=1848601 RepID=UPI000CFD1341|nr:DUF1684 domain-containing protein [Arthrobacter sp. MYb227]PQZ92931.1 hypothetical protein CQ018_10710 [Arthrobacter sp. MYb227]
MSTQTTKRDRLTQRWERFRTNRNEALAEAHGWLTLTSFQWLPETPTAFDNIPGLWSVSEGKAVLSASAEDSLSLITDASPVDGTISIALADEQSISWVSYGTVVVELGMRANRYMIRTRDSAAPTFTSFTGVPVFDYNPDFVLKGTFTPYDQPRTEVIGTAHPEVPGKAVLVGEVSFELAGARHTLAAAAGELGSLVVTFFDASNNASTAAWRKLELTKPRPDDSVVVDFNRAINYPSAFSDFGTCPQPVAANTLLVPVEAGERDPR